MVGEAQDQRCEVASQEHLTDRCDQGKVPVRYDKTRFKKNYMKEVIVRLDFFAPVERLVTSLPPKVARAATVSFPIAEPADVQPQEWTVSAGQMSHIS
jgi:hypothetical protein